MSINPTGKHCNLQSALPFLQFAFATIPTLRFDLRLLGGNILNLAFVENWLRDVFCSLMEPYTLPDKATSD